MNTNTNTQARNAAYATACRKAKKLGQPKPNKEAFFATYGVSVAVQLPNDPGSDYWHTLNTTPVDIPVGLNQMYKAALEAGTLMGMLNEMLQQFIDGTYSVIARNPTTKPYCDQLDFIAIKLQNVEEVLKAIK